MASSRMLIHISVSKLESNYAGQRLSLISVAGLKLWARFPELHQIDPIISAPPYFEGFLYCNWSQKRAFRPSLLQTKLRSSTKIKTSPYNS